MDVQAALASAIVIACAAYAATALAPASLRRRAAAMALRAPLLSRSARLARAAAGDGACGCAGCEHASGAMPSSKVVTLHRRPGATSGRSP